MPVLKANSGAKIGVNWSGCRQCDGAVLEYLVQEPKLGFILVYASRCDGTSRERYMWTTGSWLTSIYSTRPFFIY